MKNSTQTTFAGKNPFVPKPAPSQYKPLDISGIEKTRDPYAPDRVVKCQKYDELFSGVQEGDCFRVPGGEKERSALARALRVYLQRKGIDGIVRQNGRTEDGIGRVWLVKIVGKAK